MRVVVSRCWWRVAHGGGVNCILNTLVCSAVLVEVCGLIMVHSRSTVARTRRRARAAELGFLRAAPQGKRHILVPDHLAGRARDQAEALEAHSFCVQQAGRPFHYLHTAAHDPKLNLDKDLTAKLDEVNKRAAKSRHNWKGYSLQDCREWFESYPRGGAKKDAWDSGDGASVPAGVDDHGDRANTTEIVVAATPASWEDMVDSDSGETCSSGEFSFNADAPCFVPVLLENTCTLPEYFNNVANMWQLSFGPVGSGNDWGLPSAT